MIEIKNLTLQRGTRTLLKNINISLLPNKKIGLIGENGSGKSSFFSLLKGEIFSDSGGFFIPNGIKISSVSQETPHSDLSALNYVLEGDQQLSYYQNKLQKLLEYESHEELGLIYQKLEEIDAYTAPSRAGKLLYGLGFTEEEHLKKVKEFSGGWRMRLNLAQALICPGNLLLLDEPTNHLDLETVNWLKNYLRNLKATQLIISHDKDFLNAVTDQTLELRQQQLFLYGGNYHFFEKEKAQRLELAHTQYKKQQRNIEHLQSFIGRFRYKASKAKQAQSRIKALEKMELLSPAYSDNEFYFEFKPIKEVPNQLMKINNLVLGYNNIALTKPFNFSIESGSRYALLGLNGSGKSTLIKTIIGEIQAISGEIIPSNKLKIGYYAQHQLDRLVSEQTPIEHIRKIAPNIKEQEIRNFLASFNFKEDRINEKINHFSGGEKARLALAIIVWQEPNLLLLDEPTNHLDLNMRQALNMALQNFEGALILVSHDRTLIESSCDEFIYIDHKKINFFDGDIDDYLEWVLKTKKNSTKENKLQNHQADKHEKKAQHQSSKEKISSIKSYKKNIEKIEKKIHELQQEKIKIQLFLSSDETYLPENRQLLDDNIKLLSSVESSLSKLEEEWLKAEEEIEELMCEN